MRTCAYEGCRHEIKPGSPYCKYHARMIEIEDKYPKWLRARLKKMREESNSGVKIECGK